MSSTYGELLRDIRLGKEHGEDQIQEFLLSHFGMMVENVGAEKKGWDLEVIGIDIEYKKDKFRTDKAASKAEKRFFNKYGKTFEIKRDFVSDRTGNFFYEVWSNKKSGNPGCLFTSKADTIVIVRKKEYIFVDRSLLNSWVTTQIYTGSKMSAMWRKKTSPGKNEKVMRNIRSNKQVYGILIPIKDIRSIAIAVFKRG